MPQHNPSDTNTIGLFGITKNFGNYRALDNVNLVIPEGQFLTLLGPSGSGKSTLLMTIAGFVEPTGGNLFSGSKSLVGVPPEKRNFGVVFQGYALFPHMTVSENVAYPLCVRKIAKSEIARRVTETLELVQLGHLASRLPKQLSGGQQQRVALARALAFDPTVLLLDEPMGALDKNLRHDLQMELRQLHRRLGRTFVNVTHDQEEAMAMSDRIAIMHNGAIVQIGRPDELYNAPICRFVASFLGKSNFLDGSVVERERNKLSVKTADGIVHHETPELDAEIHVGSKVVLALRPQRVIKDAKTNRLMARVASSIFLGTHAEVLTRTASGAALSLHMDVRNPSELPIEGSEIAVGWDPTSTVVLAA